MVDAAELGAWRRSAIDGLATATLAAPDARLHAYPSWTVRDLAVHVVQVCANAALTLREGTLERPSPEVTVTAASDPSTLAEAIVAGLDEAEDALADCRHEVVWSPVGPMPPSFWERRLLREAALHRWDAEQAGADGVPAHAGDVRADAHAPTPPPESCALELVAEFLETDVARALADAEQERTGVVDVVAGGSTTRVDLSVGVVPATGAAAESSVSGGAAAVWLWLMRREGLPEPVTVTDGDGSAAAFTALIDGFRRPAG